MPTSKAEIHSKRNKYCFGFCQNTFRLGRDETVLAFDIVRCVAMYENQNILKYCGRRLEQEPLRHSEPEPKREALIKKKK